MPVVNYHKSIVKNRPQDEWPIDYVYIGRPGRGLKGPFGNPIKAEEVCPVCGEIHRKPCETLSCYDKWLRNRVEMDPHFSQQVKSLLGKTLTCFCHPKPCHGDILEKMAVELNMPNDERDKS